MKNPSFLGSMLVFGGINYQPQLVYSRWDFVSEPSTDRKIRPKHLGLGPGDF